MFFPRIMELGKYQILGNGLPEKIFSQEGLQNLEALDLLG